jgi:hypothetical protein
MLVLEINGALSTRHQANMKPLVTLLAALQGLSIKRLCGRSIFYNQF